MNLIEGIQAKCRMIRDTIIPAYEEIGPAGAFGRVMLQRDIEKGERAIASGDAVEMIATLKELTETCERAL